MKIKQTLLIFALFVGIGSILFSPVVLAATCGGVETSVIGCEQTGCVGGENPVEGTKPKTDAEAAAYINQYGHKYGLCKGDVLPNKNTATSGIWGLLLYAINILTAGIGIAAVGGVLYGSILYTTASGNPEQTKKAKVTIVNVVIGLVAYALMYSFLNFIIPGGLFTS